MKLLFFWSFSPKLYEMLLNLTVGISIINYLGPSEQGKIGFLINFCMLMSFLTTLGIGPVFSTFVSRSVNEKLIAERLKYNIALRFLGYVVFLLISISFILLLKKDLFFVAIPFLIGKLFFSFDIYYNLVEGKAKFKEYALSKFISLTIINLFRVYCIVQDKNIYWVAFSYFLTDFLTFFIYFIIYDKFKYFGFRFSYNRSLIILKANYKLALSTIVVSLFTQIDIVMIGATMGDKAAGEFYASTRLATPLVFISTIVISTFFSSLSRKWISNRDDYYDLISFVSGVVFFSYLIIVSIVTCFGYQIFYLFFSHEYKEAYGLFYIHILSVIFVLLGPITGKHLIIKKDYSAELNKTLLAAIINIILTFIIVFGFKNLYMIAVSTALSYMMANFGYFLLKRDWDFVLAILKGVNPVFLVSYGKKIFS